MWDSLLARTRWRDADEHHTLRQFVFSLLLFLYFVSNYKFGWYLCEATFTSSVPAYAFPFHLLVITSRSLLKIVFRKKFIRQYSIFYFFISHSPHRFNARAHDSMFSPYSKESLIFLFGVVCPEFIEIRFTYLHHFSLWVFHSPNERKRKRRMTSEKCIAPRRLCKWKCTNSNEPRSKTRTMEILTIRAVRFPMGLLRIFCVFWSTRKLFRFPGLEGAIRDRELMLNNMFECKEFEFHESPQSSDCTNQNQGRANKVEESDIWRAIFIETR